MHVILAETKPLIRASILLVSPMLKQNDQHPFLSTSTIRTLCIAQSRTLKAVIHVKCVIKYCLLNKIK